MLWNRTHDARSRPVKLLRPGWRLFWPFETRRQVMPMTPEARVAAHFPRRLRIEAGVWITVMLLAGVGLVLLMGYALARRGAPTGLSAGLALQVGTYFGMGLALSFVAFLYRLTRFRATIVNGLLQEGLCPSCGYCIVDNPPEVDGCTRCPECGAAWRCRHTPEILSP